MFLIHTLYYVNFFLSRVCLLPKALAIAQLYNVNTCIVVDSGATCTSVSVVINGKVDMTRCQNINVGGWHVSQFLKQALDWKNQKDNALVNLVVLLYSTYNNILSSFSVKYYIVMYNQNNLIFPDYCIKFRYFGCETKMQAIFEFEQRNSS